MTKLNNLTTKRTAGNIQYERDDTSPVKTVQGGVHMGVALVDVTDSLASPVRTKVAGVWKAWKKYQVIDPKVFAGGYENYDYDGNRLTDILADFNQNFAQVISPNIFSSPNITVTNFLTGASTSFSPGINCDLWAKGSGFIWVFEAVSGTVKAFSSSGAEEHSFSAGAGTRAALVVSGTRVYLLSSAGGYEIFSYAGAFLGSGTIDTGAPDWINPANVGFGAVVVGSSVFFTGHGETGLPGSTYTLWEVDEDCAFLNRYVSGIPSGATRIATGNGSLYMKTGNLISKLSTSGSLVSSWSTVDVVTNRIDAI